MQTEEQLLNDINNLKIQGATDIAMAVLDALEQNPSKDLGTRLAYARPTEPLAQNAVRYVFAGENVQERIAQYNKWITDAKQKIISNGCPLIQNNKTYLTHCHASTVSGTLISAHNKGISFSIISTETRPRFQGRITVRELLDAGIDDVTMIIDAAAAPVMTDRHVDAVLIGADLLSDRGFANKIGSLSIILSAQKFNIPVYSFTTLLKFDPKPFDKNILEIRNPHEIWEDPPENLKIFAPAFDYIPYDTCVQFVTEAGILSGDKLKETAVQYYGKSLQ